MPNDKKPNYKPRKQTMKPVINYRRTIIALTNCPVAGAGIAPGVSAGAFAMQGDKTDIARWIDSRFAKGQLPPFSFILDESRRRSSSRSWRWSRTAPASTDKDVVLRTFTYTDPRSGLEVVCDVKGYPEFRRGMGAAFPQYVGKEFRATLHA